MTIKERARRYRRWRQRRGLRTDGKPRAPRKPCGCLHGCCLQCAKPGNRHYYSPEQIAEIVAAYNSPMSASAVERQFGLPARSLKHLLDRRGIPYRVTSYASAPRDPKTGRVLPRTPATAREISAAVAALDFPKLPEELAKEWRGQTNAWRRRLVELIWDKFPTHRMPRGVTFSKNVRPFDWFSPEAQQIVREMNQGRNSRTKLIQLRSFSTGLIWDGRLWFWYSRDDRNCEAGYLGQWPNGQTSTGRALLHRAIWERANGQPVPERHLVIFKDGNRRNFDPSNLGLMSMADNARRNHWPNNPELQRTMGARIWDKRLAKQAQQARAATSALVQNGSLLAALTKG